MRDSLRTLAKALIPKHWLPYELLEEPYFYRLPNSKKIRSLKGAYAGERCFILGNGPSLNKVNLGLLRNEQSFGVNGIFYKTDQCGYVPSFYVVEDKAVMKDNLERINEYPAPLKFFPINYKHLIYNRHNVLFFRMNTGFYQTTSAYYGIPRFSVDFAKRIYCGQSVTILNLQIAYYLGFTKVYLVGMDFDYTIPTSAIVRGKEIISTDEDANHFHPQYFGPGKTWHDPQLDKVLRSYQLAKLIFEQDDRHIFNATVGGKLELFERVDFSSLFS